MDRQEAVQKLATVGRLSIAHAEDLYDSFFPKPVVKQCVADWYEEHKNDLNDDIWAYLTSWADTKWDEFKYWMYHTGRNEAITTIVNMHQFGYEVEKKKLFKVRLKGTGQYLCNDETGPHFIHGFKTDFTKDSLVKLGFGWVFDCEGIEIEGAE